MTQPAMQTGFEEGRRRGVRRTVTVLAVVVGFFFLLSFLQIILMR